MIRMAQLEISHDRIRELLQLPDGVRIIAFGHSFDQAGVIEIIIDGAGWEINIGDRIVATKGVCSNGPDGELEIDWNLP